MARLPKIFYLLVPLVLIVLLTGCELRREEGDISDPGAVSDLPPTLAPLGAETNLVVEATPIATIINVQPTATQSNLQAGQAAENTGEPVAPTSQPDALSASEVVVAGAAAITVESPETFTPPVQEAAAGEVTAQEAIVVDATTSDDLPIGGPVAANPPASQTTGSYDTSATVYDGSGYTVQPGDTLFSIAMRYGTSVSAIAAANGLPSDMIYAGQTLSIPGANADYAAPIYEQPAVTYDNYTNPAYQPQITYDSVGQSQHIVANGDTLFSISMRYGVSVDAVAGLNGIPYPYFIQAGQTLAIPAPGQYAGPPPPAPEGFFEQPYYEQQPYQDYPAQPADNNFAPVPGIAGTHTVAPGETLFSIAMGYGTSAEALAAANGLANPNQIYVGQVLYLP